MAIRIMMVVESNAETEAEAMEAIDRFREASLPGPCYGLTISRATCEDVRESGLHKQVSPIGPVPSAFVRPWPVPDSERS